MRQACLPALVHRRTLQLVLGGILIVTSVGCHQHYHYYTSAACPPGTAPAAVQYGAVCDTPTQVVDGGTVLSDSPSRSTTVSGTTNSSRVVVSQPKSSSSSFSWRRSDPDASSSVAATTTVEGGLNGSTVNR